MNYFKPDLSKPTCRVCLKNKTDEKMSSIFDMDAELYDLRIYEKIERCSGIKIICDEKFPAFICCHCNECLKISYKFRTTCENSEEYLKIIVQTEETEPKKETFLKQNDLSKVQTTGDDITNFIYKRGCSLSPLPEPLKEEHNNKISCSPAQYEETFNEFLSDKESDIWIDISYSDGEESLLCVENVEIPVQNLDLELKEGTDITCTDEKPSKSKKRSYVRKKRENNTLKKSLEISTDGAVVVKKKKSRAKKETTKQPHVCEICGNVYNRRHILEHHIKRHSDKKEFECEICGHAFHSSFELRRHMRKHTGSRPYKCSYCPSAFGDHSTLTKHERVHRNERPFKCDICGSTFSYPGVLKRHKLVHTGEKPYKCEICGKCFNDRYHLKSHLKTIQHRNDPRVESLLKNIKENNV